MKNKVWFRYLFTSVAVIVSAFLQAYTINVFVHPANLLSGGFTGVAILLDRIASLWGLGFSTSLGMLLLNVPVAILCYKHIGKKFVIFSMIQVFLTSILLNFLTFPPLFDEVVLNVFFGGFVNGMAIVIALRGNASTAGTDFIALYISNKKGKSIWEYVLVFNACILIIFGFMFGWIYAGYSIVFQFISTKTISSFYQRYKRVTLQITTSKTDKVVDAYIKLFHHGLSVVDGYGGYSKQPVSLLHTVVSAYEVQDIISMLLDVDENIIVNVIPTENFYGRFYQQPIE